MRTEPLSIAGIAGPIVVARNAFWGTTTVTVGGIPAPKVGKRLFALPATAGGVIEAYIPRTFFDPYPSVEIDGIPHRTGPTVPVALKVLAALPLLLAGIGGAAGGLFGALGLLTNLAVARTRLPSAAKALVMVGVSIVAFVVWLTIALAVHQAVSPS